MLPRASFFTRMISNFESCCGVALESVAWTVKLLGLSEPTTSRVPAIRPEVESSVRVPAGRLPAVMVHAMGGAPPTLPKVTS